MGLDLPVDKLLLAAFSLVVGTILPTVYRRLRYAGVSIRQPFEVWILSEQSERDPPAVLFGTVVRIANVSKDGLLLDAITLRAVSLGGFTFQQRWTEVKVIATGDPIHLPPSSAPAEHPMDFLPVVVGPNEAATVAVGIGLGWSGVSQTGEPSPCELLGDRLRREGLPVALRINGKYRDFVLRIGGSG